MRCIQQWSTLICLTSVICVIIELILPPGKMEKVMYMVLSIFILCSFTSSIKEIFKIKLDFNKIKSENISKNLGFINDINTQIKNLAENNIRKIIINNLNDIKINPKKVEILMDTTEDNCISIIKSKIFLHKEDIALADKVKSTIESKLKIETEVTVN